MSQQVRVAMFAQMFYWRFSYVQHYSGLSHRRDLVVVVVVIVVAAAVVGIVMVTIVVVLVKVGSV